MSRELDNQKGGLNHVEWQRSLEDSEHRAITQRGIELARFAIKHGGRLPDDELDPHAEGLTDTDKQFLYQEGYEQAQRVVERMRSEQ